MAAAAGLLQLHLWYTGISKVHIYVQPIIALQARLNLLYVHFQETFNIDSLILSITLNVVLGYPLKFAVCLNWVGWFQWNNMFIQGKKLPKVSSPLNHFQRKVSVGQNSWREREQGKQRWSGEGERETYHLRTAACCEIFKRLFYSFLFLLCILMHCEKNSKP